MTVEGFTVDIRHADVVGLEIDDQTVTVTAVVPVADVVLSLSGDTQLVHRAVQ